MTFDEWQSKYGPNGGAYDIEMQSAGWDGAMRYGRRPIELPDDFINSVGLLCDAARMTGGVAGRDEELCRHLDRVEAMLEAIRDPDWQAGARGELPPMSTLAGSLDA